MPRSKKRPAKRGTESLLPNALQRAKSGFDPKQSRLPNGLNHKVKGGGKPKLFPGRTGGR